MDYRGRGLHGQTVEQLGTLVVSGAIAQGAPLPAENLERDFGVSRTVVREALKVLAAKGLVESRPKRGTIVRPRSDWNLLDPDVLRWQNLAGVPDFSLLESLQEVRAIVEPAAARLAAGRRTDDDIAELSSALTAMEAARGDADALVAADIRFHEATLEATHNELLTRMKVILSAGLQMRDTFVHHSSHDADPVPAHRAVYDAILAQDAALAMARVEALLAQSAEDLAILREREQSTPATSHSG